jgi:hypothetical protein
MRNARIDALYACDADKKVRLAHENPVVKQFYAEMVGEIGSPAAKARLHTSYLSRAADLGE